MLRKHDRSDRQPYPAGYQITVTLLENGEILAQFGYPCQRHVPYLTAFEKEVLRKAVVNGELAIRGHRTSYSHAFVDSKNRRNVTIVTECMCPYAALIDGKIAHLPCARESMVPLVCPQNNFWRAAAEG